jgi:hypothetical protein
MLNTPKGPINVKSIIIYAKGNQKEKEAQTKYWNGTP